MSKIRLNKKNRKIAVKLLAHKGITTINTRPIQQYDINHILLKKHNVTREDFDQFVEI